MTRLPKQLRRQVAADRARQPVQWPPADHRDEYDPSPEPVERRPS